MTHTIFIDGEAGTTGLEIRERLAGRADIEIVAIPAEKRKDIEAKRAILVRTQTERAAYERVVQELERNSRDLEVLIRHAQAPPPRTLVAEARSPFAFVWPARGAFTSGFGRRRHPIFGAMKGWFTIEKGYDLTQPAMPEWTEMLDEKYGPESQK